MKLVIDRSKWLRGAEDNPRLLRPSDNKMCCLGFYALKCGYSDLEIKDLGDPEDQCHTTRKNLWPEWAVEEEQRNVYDDMDYPTGDTEIVFHQSGIIQQLIEANDNPDLDDSEREATIARLFDSQGVKVEFV